DDLLIIAPSPSPRRFGTKEDGVVTDAEMAYVRRSGGKVTEAGLAGGRRLELAGKTLLEVGPDILSARVRYNGDVAEVSTRGGGQSAWKRVVNPQQITDHYYLRPDLENGKMYQVRLTCRSADGRVGVLQKDYTHAEPAKDVKR